MSAPPRTLSPLGSTCVGRIGVGYELAWAIPDSVFIATPWIQLIRDSLGERHW